MKNKISLFSSILLIPIFLFLSCRDKDRVGIPITILAWSGYEEEDFKSLVEEKVPNIDLDFITYTGGEDMLRKYFTNKNSIDLIVVDAEYGKILNDRNELRKINQNEIPNAINNIKESYFDPFNFSQTPNTPGFDSTKGDFYCITARWGTVSIVADISLKDEIKSIGYEILLEEKLEDKTIIFDWYLPNMGIFALSYLKNKGIENKNPYDLNKYELLEMRDSIMIPYRKNIRGFYSDLGKVINEVYEENTLAVAGIGEWAIGNTMKKDNKSNKDWYVPEEGAIMWIEALAIPINIENNKLNKVFEIIELFTTPELQSKLAWRNAYTSHAPNAKAYQLMSEEERTILKHGELKDMMKRLYFRKVPSTNILEDWLSIWAEFKKETK